MINGLQSTLDVASAASECQKMTWGRAVAHLEALELQVSKTFGHPPPVVAANLATLGS